MQAVQVGRQFAELVAGQVEDFQAVGQVKQLSREPAQAKVGQADMAGTGQCAAVQVVKGMHGGAV